MRRSHLAAGAVLACALCACKGDDTPPKDAPPPVPLLPAWRAVADATCEVDLPGEPKEEPEEVAAGVKATVKKVRLATGLYEFGRAEAKGVLEGTQHRKLFLESFDSTLAKQEQVSLSSETELKLEAGTKGISWPARDSVYKDAAGRPCHVRAVFAREHVFLLAACLAAASTAPSTWERMRDSLKIKVDPLPEGAGAADVSSWATYSPDGKASLRQRYSQKGLCTLVCDRDVKEVWKAETECQGTGADAHFVADDCERSVLFAGAPQRDESLLSVRFIRVFARDKVEYEVQGAALLKKSATVKRYNHLVKGLGGNTGDKPAYAADGKSVAFETVEGKKQSVPLKAEQRPAEPVAGPPSDEPAAEEPAPAPPRPVKKKKRR